MSMLLEKLRPRNRQVWVWMNDDFMVTTQPWPGKAARGFKDGTGREVRD